MKSLFAIDGAKTIRVNAGWITQWMTTWNHFLFLCQSLKNVVALSCHTCCTSPTTFSCQNIESERFHNEFLVLYLPFQLFSPPSMTSRSLQTGNSFDISRFEVLNDLLLYLIDLTRVKYYHKIHIGHKQLFILLLLASKLYWSINPAIEQHRLSLTKTIYWEKSKILAERTVYLSCRPVIFKVCDIS